MCDENLLAGMKMFLKTLTFCKTSRKILDIYVSAAVKQTNEQRNEQAKEQTNKQTNKQTNEQTNERTNE